MSAETASNTATPRLRRNVLDLPQVVFQGITHIAPSINIVFTFPIISLKAGPAMPISFFLTTELARLPWLRRHAAGRW